MRGGGVKSTRKEDPARARASSEVALFLFRGMKGEGYLSTFLKTRRLLPSCINLVTL